MYPVIVVLWPGLSIRTRVCLVLAYKLSDKLINGDRHGIPLSAVPAAWNELSLGYSPVLLSIDGGDEGRRVFVAVKACCAGRASAAWGA